MVQRLVHVPAGERRMDRLFAGMSDVRGRMDAGEDEYRNV